MVVCGTVSAVTTTPRSPFPAVTAIAEFTI
jgi:hypothetical protein